MKTGATNTPSKAGSCSSPEVKDVAEDVTREIVDRLPGHNISQRIFGTVDYKKARYVILPEQIVRQALFVDSKAEKTNQNATLQISQTSLEVRQVRSGVSVSIKGKLPAIYVHENNNYLSTTLFLHYCYRDVESKYLLDSITACCVPNGLLQERYNPSPDRTFWVAGRNAPSRGEEFRVRVSFSRLSMLAPWRVQHIKVVHEDRQLLHTWQE